MDVSIFDPKSVRVHKARLGRALAHWIPVFYALIAVCIVVGVALLVLEQSIGWAVLGFFVIPFMIVQWYGHELRDVPVIKNGTRIDDLVESEILGLLPDQPSPKDVASVVGQTKGGLFFSARYGLSGSFLEQVLSTNRDDTPALFKEALNIAKQNGGEVTAGVLILAAIRQLPGKGTLLGHLQLDEVDIEQGIRWYARLGELITLHSKTARKSGGIGRDWSFGWIPLLSRYGRNISASQLIHADIRQETLDQLTKGVANGGSVVIVGQMGVGKTQVVYELASSLMNAKAAIPEKLRYRQVFMLDAAKLLSATGERGDLEGLVSALLGEAYRAKNIIICLDNAQVFFEEGVGSVDISGLLLPVLEAGRLPIILTMDEQRYLQISKRTPALVNAVNRVNLAPTNEADTLRVLEDHLPELEFRRNVTYMYQALREAYKLSARYVYDTSMPGQAITLLESAAEYAESGLVTVRSVNIAIEKTVGVKTNIVDDESERETLLNMEGLIHERMIGQERAVGVVSDALRRARAGVRNQKRPVGTFMFLGPTGVGKTELAKSLAAVYFGGEDKIIRLDMNEFVSPDDVMRLIADGTDDPNSLTARVMKQPFSVVLLDEIEKAHSTVLTTLLQLLDEGILRDARNREVSFRDTIVIATSNAGSDRIQEYLHRGYSLQQFEETFVNELISSNLFHPEFLNRFDEIVVFGPLSKNELLQVVDLILVEVNKNMAEQKVTVVVTQEAKEYLVEAGYDPRLGARPMRRVVQRAVENTVAKHMLVQIAGPGDSIEITLEQVKEMLEKRKRAGKIVEENK